MKNFQIVYKNFIAKQEPLKGHIGYNNFMFILCVSFLLVSYHSLYYARVHKNLQKIIKQIKVNINIFR